MSASSTSIFFNLSFRQPPSPDLVNEGKRLIQQDNVTVEEVARILSSDISFAVFILKRANNAYYGLSGNVNSLTHAVEILGISNVLAMIETSASSDRANLPMRMTSEHAFVTAQISHRLTYGHWIWSNNGHSTIGGVFTAGLLHSIGRLAICTSHPEQANVLYGYSDHAFPVSGSLLELEQLQFGADYSEVGAFIGVKYRLPSDLTDVIRHIEDPTALKSSNPSYNLAMTVNAASNLATSLGYGINPQGSFVQLELSPGLRWIENQTAGLASIVLAESHQFLTRPSRTEIKHQERGPDRDPAAHLAAKSQTKIALSSNRND
ncbi:MAG: HDOD domain-containing protein [Bacteroidetes bacterium]|nr:HDOD domain-containing protein [Bacteroidota bacterium]